ncbi:MAG: hypothetical protein QOF61_2053 [Acidobacteriota bacterium]|nr:hypothetical protein [Acidobacteriota bacterium]
MDNKCPKCGAEVAHKPHNTRENNSYCVGCQRGYGRRHYQNNKTYYIEKAKRRQKEFRDIVRKAKDTPCADCGVHYPYFVMDFDHRENKIFELSSGLRCSMAALLAEIAKCGVVCANCHRFRTQARKASVETADSGV